VLCFGRQERVWLLLLLGWAAACYFPSLCRLLSAVGQLGGKRKAAGGQWGLGQQRARPARK
jgi:hypothetical protein